MRRNKGFRKKRNRARRSVRQKGSSAQAQPLYGIMADKLREAYNISAEFHRQAMEAFREPVDGPRDERGHYGEDAAF